MDLLLDTQLLVFLGTAPERLTRTAKEAILSSGNRNFLSAVTAFEFADLNRRGRFGADLPLGAMLPLLEAVVLDYPREAWRLADTLPALHRDPVDRMLVAHAIHADLTLVTADATIRAYPVRTLW